MFKPLLLSVTGFEVSVEVKIPSSVASFRVKCVSCKRVEKWCSCYVVARSGLNFILLK